MGLLSGEATLSVSVLSPFSIEEGGPRRGGESTLKEFALVGANLGE